MNRILKTIAVTMMSVIMLASCGNKAAKDISVADTAKAVLDATTVVGELVEMSEDNVEMLYTKFDKKILEEYKVYACASRATCEEVALVKAKDVDAVKKMFEQRVSDLITENRDYNPNEMPKLEKPLITAKGDYVLLVIADDTSEAESAFEKAFK